MSMALHSFVSGRVQGVWFRQSTKDKADSLGLTGWVRNLPDGRVEVMACGDTKAICQLEAWLGQGPELANVAEVQSEQLELDTGFDEFLVR